MAFRSTLRRVCALLPTGRSRRRSFWTCPEGRANSKRHCEPSYRTGSEQEKNPGGDHGRKDNQEHSDRCIESRPFVVRNHDADDCDEGQGGGRGCRHGRVRANALLTSGGATSFREERMPVHFDRSSGKKEANTASRCREFRLCRQSARRAGGNPEVARSLLGQRKCRSSRQHGYLRQPILFSLASLRGCFSCRQSSPLSR
jgi:hypothetical protein